MFTSYFTVILSIARVRRHRTPRAPVSLAEVFCRYTSTLRSSNLNHSICTIGPNAAFLTQDHHRSETS
ncbi:AAC(3) family N-acetyltransferase [Thioflavicoccus mobilis]|uniref:AAC(3) family N-acetyltransferase n=1 Tax=Thioflavicoccus mobilis TaxID=80679 RepID=UPI003CCC3A19